MAKYGSDKVAFLLIDGYSVLGVTTTLTDNVEAILVDTTVLGSSWAEQGSTGIRKGELTQEGFYDDATNSSNAALVSTVGTSRVLNYGVEGNTIGKALVGWNGALQVKYGRVASRGELHRANATYTTAGAVEQGVILQSVVTKVANGNSQASSVDNAASSASGGAGYLQVTAISLGGYTALVSKIQHSADNVTFTDLLTFTNTSSAPSAERKTVAGTVNRYLAANWAWLGSGSNPSATFMFGFVRN